MKYSYSIDDGESFFGAYDSRGAAAEGARDCLELEETKTAGQSVLTARNVAPPPPESFWDAESWLEQVSMQDEYCFLDDHWFYDLLGLGEKEARALTDELEKEVRAVMAAWLDRHDLRPTHFIAADVEKTVFPSAEKHSEGGTP